MDGLSFFNHSVSPRVVSPSYTFSNYDNTEF